MILVTDIGSTKADWILMDESGILIRFDTIGFNPFFVDSSDIVNELQSKSELTELRNKSLELFFYGAGCSSSERKEIVLNAMKSLLPEALIKVEHDLLGAARATAGDEPGVICILGTGSNACFFDGNKIEGGLPSLGFILGDEGSGSYFGKRILTDYFYQRMPANLAEQFQSKFNIQLDAVLSDIYSGERPNAYLAGFMEFVSEQRSERYMHDLLYEGIARFISIHVWNFPRFRDYPVHFVGSISYYFREVLEEVAFNHKFTVGKTENKPIEPLARYHFNRKYTGNESERLHF